MAIRKIDELIKIGSHPLEAHFDIDDNSTEIVTTERKTELAPYEPYDKKDTELEEDYQMILDKAMDVVDVIKRQIDGNTEAKYLARLSEVLGQQLGVALSAAEKKAKLKESKDNLELKKAGGGNKTITNNNVIFLSRDQMLEEVQRQHEAFIEGEATEVKQEKLTHDPE